MLKRFSILLVAGAAACGLAACSGPAPKAATPSVSQTPYSLAELRESQEESYQEYLSAEPGSCWNSPESTTDDSWRVNCDEPHRVEVVAAWDEVPTGPYDEQTQERLDQECALRQGTVSPRDDGTNTLGVARTITLEAPQWDEAAHAGTSVHVACAWYYVTDQTGFATP